MRPTREAVIERGGRGGSAAALHGRLERAEADVVEHGVVKERGLLRTAQAAAGRSAQPALLTGSTRAGRAGHGAWA